MSEARSPRHLAWGRALRRIRREKGVSQESLAHKARLERSYYGAVERGERNPALTNLFRIADALEVTVSEIALTAEQETEGQAAD